jgi:hypothetical protein
MCEKWRVGRGERNEKVSKEEFITYWINRAHHGRCKRKGHGLLGGQVSPKEEVTTSSLGY